MLFHCEAHLRSRYFLQVLQRIVDEGSSRLLAALRLVHILSLDS
jgi:hypothetical protein